MPASLVFALGSHQAQKERALELHHSQRVLPRASEVFAKYGHEECYLLAATRAQSSGQDADMFAGIADEGVNG